MATNILIVDDHALVRRGICLTFAEDTDFRIVGEAPDARSAYKLVDETRPDLVIMDLMLPGEDGIAATAEIRRRNRATRVVVVSGWARTDLAAYAFEAGADGIVLKSQPPEDLRAAVHVVMRGGRYLSPEIDATAVEQRLMQRARGERATPLDALSAREREVFSLQTRGLSAKQIARELCISEKTVQTHRARIFRKLNVHSTVELVRFAAEHGLLTPTTH
jgi:DNA-binding NarL/FixJ family response regulator